MVDRGPSGFIYKLNFATVSGDLLLALTKLVPPEVSQDSEAILLVHEDIKLSAINNLIGIMAKAGIVHARVFFFRRDKELMTELTHSKIGAPQRESILAAGLALQQAGVIKADVDVKKTVDDLIDDRWVAVTN